MCRTRLRLKRRTLRVRFNSRDVYTNKRPQPKDSRGHLTRKLEFLLSPPLSVIMEKSRGKAAKLWSVNHTKDVTFPHTSVPVLFPKNVFPTGRDKYQIQLAITHTPL